MIIGDKETFAVEIIIDKNIPGMGYAKLWLQNTFLGTKEDLIFLNGYLISLIDELINSTPIRIDIQDKKTTEIFNSVKSSDENRSEYAIIGATFTDDFEIYSFEKFNDIFIFWKLRDVEMIFDELKFYSKEVHIGKVSKHELEEIKEKVKQEINLAFL